MVRIDLTHANPSDWTAQLISSTGSTLTIAGPIVAGDYEHEYVVSGATGLALDGTWTLQVTDSVKNRKRGSLIEWTMAVTPEGAAAQSQSAAATDMAMAAWPSWIHPTTMTPTPWPPKPQRAGTDDDVIREMDSLTPHSG